MFKNMLKRSWLSTVRKPSRTAILVVILFVMANMLLATVAIRNSVNKSMDFAKEKLGGIVYLQPDTAKVREQMQAARENGETTQLTQPTISETLAKNIAQSKYTKDYTYSLGATANASGFTVVETAQNEREKQFQDALNNAKTQVENKVDEYESAQTKYNSDAAAEAGRGSGRRPNFNFNFDVNISDPTLGRGDTTLQGINSFAFISDVEAGNMKIIDGNAFNENTTDGAVVSSELAEANSWAVGGEIKLKTLADATEIPLKIVGIYKTSTENFDYNTIYMNIDSVKKFLTSATLENLTVQNVRYYLNSASDKDAFLAEMAQKYPEIATNNLSLDIDDSGYQTMVGPIEQVGGFAVTIMWVVMVAAVVIITLIVVINVKDRRYEMGVLLSLGAKRRNILGQVFIELIIVGTLGFALSLGTSQILAQKMGEGLLKQQVATTEQAETASEHTMTAPDGTNYRMRGANAMATNVQKIDEIDVKAGASEYLTLFGAGYVILIIAMILPSVNILRYQPKTILTGKE